MSLVIPHSLITTHYQPFMVEQTSRHVMPTQTSSPKTKNLFSGTQKLGRLLAIDTIYSFIKTNKKKSSVFGTTRGRVNNFHFGANYPFRRQH